MDVHSHQLLWEYLALLIRQNGYCDLKTDIASLLLGENHSWQPVNDDSDDDVANALNSKLKMDDDRLVLATLKQHLSNGNKLNAIDWLSKNNQWSHAFFIASTMQPSTALSTMTNKLKLKFINSIAQRDPVHTLYQLYVGRVPTLNAIDWTEWRTHLSLILSNYDSADANNEALVNNSIKKFADTLASHARFAAAHFCYLLANTPFADFRKKSSKIVLIGSSHK
jgi:hypothetical protein